MSELENVFRVTNENNERICEGSKEQVLDYLKHRFTEGQYPDEYASNSAIEGIHDFTEKDSLEQIVKFVDMRPRYLEIGPSLSIENQIDSILMNNDLVKNIQKQEPFYKDCLVNNVINQAKLFFLRAKYIQNRIKDGVTIIRELREKGNPEYEPIAGGPSVVYRVCTLNIQLLEPETDEVDPKKMFVLRVEPYPRTTGESDVQVTLVMNKSNYAKMTKLYDWRWTAILTEEK